MASKLKGRGMSYTPKRVLDEENAERYSKIQRRVSSDVLRRKKEGEPGLFMSEDEVEARAKNAKAIYLENAKTAEGRKINKKNLEFVEKEDLPKANSRAQYEHEKAAGDPNAMKLSFEEWQKL